MAETVEIFLRRVLRFDLEVDPAGKQVRRFGAVRGTDADGPAGEQVWRASTPTSIDRMAEGLDNFGNACEWILGHNILNHDRPVLKDLAPWLRLFQLPTIDTLFLSALAFPQRPYHRLVKDYKLVRDAVNDPVADSRLATRVFRDCRQALAQLSRSDPEVFAFYVRCFEPHPERPRPLNDHAGMAKLLRLIWHSERPLEPLFDSSFESLVEGKACGFVARQLADPEQSYIPLSLAYAVAWLRVAGEDSVLPPWLRLEFPELPGLLDRLRRSRSDGEPCKLADRCRYCSSGLSPRAELERYFGFADFRPEPRSEDGESMQRQAVVAGLRGSPRLSVLATGAGKSICYQLPALVHFRRRGLLTVVISPLQALMKDQVENLNQRLGVERAAALNGLLTPPERGQVIDRVRSGEIALLYIAPEQLRNRSFEQVIAVRELAAWVFDEAHCLSKWGHDFRPDYLFAARFIKKLAERQKVPLPTVSCFTATAKQDVITEIKEHFQQQLGIDLDLAVSKVDRQELRFSVESTPAQRKAARIAELLRERLFTDAETPNGSAVIYFASRRGTEEAAEHLRRQGFEAEAFHAGLNAPEKRRVLEAFTHGQLPLVCATNAFGMGIDKEDVRLVIHADIPGSLEAYLQEAGRAGRDRLPSDCVLLFDHADVERQFRLSASSKLHPQDLRQILRALRRAARRSPHQDGVLSLTSGELLRDEELDLHLRPDHWQADTQVRTAVAWLERAGFLERGHNSTRVFNGRPAVKDLKEARARLEALGLDAETRKRRLKILETLIQSRSEGLSVDQLASTMPTSSGRPEHNNKAVKAGVQVIRDLQNLAADGLITEGLQLSAYVRAKGKNSGRHILRSRVELERAMIDTMAEADPDAEDRGTVALSLRRLNQKLLDLGHESNPELLRKLLKSLSEDGKGLAGKKGSLELRFRRRGFYSVRLRRSWSSLRATADLRRRVAHRVLETLIAKLSTQASGQVLVEFALEDLVAAVNGDLILRSEVQDELAACERALLYLHEQRAIQLQNGLAVFRQALTLKLNKELKGRRYSNTDYAPLAEHYRERTFQTHVMARYAEEGQVLVRRGLQLVSDYFDLSRRQFAAKWFSEQKQELERATGSDSYRRIVDELGDAEQQAIVTAPVDQNLLVLAGPGSGKTRVVVHRCAYLLRVQRVPARSILVVCFNRAASLELRRRLRRLVGDDSRGVTVCTYHGLALRLTGRSLADVDHAGVFQQLITEAVQLLEADAEARFGGFEADELRENLLAGYRHILVDEYQDINQDQYRLVAAIAGQNKSRRDHKLSLLAVGDDDQTIYGFQGAKTDFIRSFRADYLSDQAKDIHYLIRCWRCSPPIVAAANELIRHNPERMKKDRPIEAIEGDRSGEPAVAQPVYLRRLQNPTAQAAEICRCVVELRRSRPQDRIAVLARTHRALEPILSALPELLPNGDTVFPLGRDKQLPLSRLRELRSLLDGLQEIGRGAVENEQVNQLLTELRAGSPAIADTSVPPWLELAESLLEEALHDSGDLAATGHSVADHIYESLAEQRKDPIPESGVVAATVQSAKGLELDHVFLIDGDWRSMLKNSSPQEERRIYYVGMTRAKKSLHLSRLMDSRPHPHLDLMPAQAPWLSFLNPRPKINDPSIFQHRFELSDLGHLYLSWAGKTPDFEEVGRRIAKTPTGARLKLKDRSQGGLCLTDEHGGVLAVLSKSGTEYWRLRQSRIQSLTVYAWIERRRQEQEPEFRAQTRIERWQVPIFRARLRP